MFWYFKDFLFYQYRLLIMKGIDLFLFSDISINDNQSFCSITTYGNDIFNRFEI